MSEQNADVVRRIWALWEKGLKERDPATLEAPFEEGLLAPDSTFTPVDAIPGERKTYVGIEGMREFSMMWLEDFSYWSIALDEVVDARDDWVVAELHQEARGRASGAKVNVRFTSVFWVRDGQVVNRRDFLGRAEAMEAATGGG